MNKPTISAAWKDALKVWRSQFGGMLLFTLFQLVLRLIALCPLLFLAAGKLQASYYLTNPVAVLSENPVRWCFLLCPLFYVFLILPARQSAAEAMQGALSGEPVFSIRMAFGGASYGQKLLRGLKTACFILLWAVPVLALLAWTARQFSGTDAGENDFITQLNKLMDFGGGDIVRGIVNAFLVLAGAMVPLMFGCAFHSGSRHEWALGEKRLVPGHRGGVLLAWFSGLLVYLPFLLVLAVFTRGYLMDVLENFKNTFMLKLSLADYRVWLTLAGIVLLLLPVISLKRMVTAAYVRLLRGEKD